MPLSFTHMGSTMTDQNKKGKAMLSNDMIALTLAATLGAGGAIWGGYKAVSKRVTRPASGKANKGTSGKVTISAPHAVDLDDYNDIHNALRTELLPTEFAEPGMVRLLEEVEMVGRSRRRKAHTNLVASYSGDRNVTLTKRNSNYALGANERAIVCRHDRKHVWVVSVK